MDFYTSVVKDSDCDGFGDALAFLIYENIAILLVGLRIFVL